ncbi:hypothetical protein D3C75_336410 [compost metagenome]
MKNNETVEDQTTADQQEQPNEEQMAELLKAVHHNGIVALKMHYKDVEAQLLTIEGYGPVFVFHVKDEEGSRYSCGFFLHELVARFQSNNSPSIWLASFFVEMMRTKGGKELMGPPASEDEAKKVIDNILVPQLIEAINEEFAPEQMHAGLAWNEKFGAVFEAGFPSIKDGSNVCAVPLHVLLTHLALNRDPSELLIQGLYNIRKENGLE